MFMGFQDVAAKRFSSVISHVHWVYCAYILLNSNPPGIPPEIRGIGQKQDIVREMIGRSEKARVLQMLTRINGTEAVKDELKRALAAA